MPQILWVVLILLLIFGILGVPSVGIWNHGYGYWPSSAGFIIALVLLFLLLR